MRMRTTARHLGEGISVGCDWLELIVKGGTNGFSRHSCGCTRQNNTVVAVKCFSLNIVPSSAGICHHETWSFSELSRPAPGEAITGFTASEHAEFPSLITLDELCKMAAVFWPPGRVAVAKRRMTTPRPPLRRRILSLSAPNPIKSVVKPITSLLFIPGLHTHRLFITKSTLKCVRYDFN